MVKSGDPFKIGLIMYSSPWYKQCRMLRYPVVTLQQIHIIKLSIIISADDLQSLNSTVVLHHHRILQWKRQQIHRRYFVDLL